MKARKFQSLVSLLSAAVISLSLVSCGGSGGDGSSSWNDDTSSENSSTGSNGSNGGSNTDKPNQPGYSGWAPKDLKSYTLVFNAGAQKFSTFVFTASNLGKSAEGNSCALDYRWIDEHTARINELSVYDKNSAGIIFNISNATLNFTDDNKGNVTGIRIQSASGNAPSADGWSTFILRK